LTFLGGFAPVPFFAAAGVTAVLQAGKYRPRSVLLTYLALFLLCFTLNAINSPDYLRPPVIHFDMVSTIAIGACSVYLLEIRFPSRVWLFFWLGLAWYGLHLWLLRLMPASRFPIWAGILLPLTGPFPLFPWLLLFPLGVFAYRVRNGWNLFLALLMVLTFAAVHALGWPLDYRNKWEMSPGYFLLSCALLFGVFFVVRRFTFFRQARFKQPLLFWGQNSLLFLVLHFGTIWLFVGLGLWERVPLFEHFPLAYWLAILLVTSIAMWIAVQAARLNALNAWFDRLWVWGILFALIFAVPALGTRDGLIRWAVIGLGTLAAAFYPRLAGLLKGQRAASAFSD